MTFFFPLSPLSLSLSLSPHFIQKTSSQFYFHSYHFSLSTFTVLQHSFSFKSGQIFLYQCKFILRVLIFVRAQLVLSLSPPSGCPFWVKICKLGHQSYPSRLKDSDFFLVCPLNCYLNLNKQKSLVFEDQF
jgi:hypothetical protein